MRTDPITEAQAAAAALDALSAADAEGVYEEALSAVGGTLGGWSTYGFVRDLRSALAAIDCDAFADAGPGDYSRGLGGNDPDHWISERLEDEIAAAQRELAARFLAAARPVLAQVAPAAVAEAA